MPAQQYKQQSKAGAKTPVVLAESMVSGYNKTNIAEQNLTVTYTDNDSNKTDNKREKITI